MEELQEHKAVLESIDVEQGQQRSENNELMNPLIRNGNQLPNENIIGDIFPGNQHNNGRKQCEEMVEDLQARNYGFVSENVVNLFFNTG